MGYFTDLLNKKDTKPVENRGQVYVDESGKLQFPLLKKPVIDQNLKISAPTGKELSLEQLPEGVRQKTEAELRESEIKMSGKSENFLSVIARAFPRATQSVVLDYLNPQGGSQTIPKTKFEKFLFGEQPVEAVSTQYEKTKQATGLPGPVAATAVFGGAIFDLTLFGGSRKKLSERIVKTITNDAAETLLRKAGVADDLIKQFAPKVVRIKKVAEAEKLLANIEKLQRTTAKVVPTISKDLQPLAQEAGKYKSVREFVNSQQKVFRGGDEPISSGRITEKGISVTTDRKVAKEFADMSGIFKGKGAIEELFYSPTAKVIKASELPNNLVAKRIKLMEEQSKLGDSEMLFSSPESRFNRAQKLIDELEREIVDFGRKNGFDIIEIPNPQGIQELRVVNPNILKTKSQLTDFYNQAIKTAPDIQKGAKVMTGVKERGFITSVKETIPEAKKVAGQYVPRATDDLAIRAKNLIKTDLNTAEKLAFTGTDDKAVATAAELLKHYSDEAAKATDQAVKNALYDKAADLANTIAPKLTEQGRAIQAASILGRLTPEGQVKFAAGQIAKYNEAAGLTKKIPELTGTQTKYILDEIKAINTMADGTGKAMRFQNLQDYISKLVPTPLFKKIIAVWKAGLLTGLKTTGVNIFANLSHIATEAVKDIPSAIVDKVVSLFTGKRAVSFGLRGLKEGSGEGLKKGLRYLTTGFDERNIGTKLDYTKVNFGKGKLAGALQKYTDSVFRLLGTEDQPFYYGAKLRSLYEQAKVAAINKGLRGAKAQDFINDLMKSPTDEMIKYASLDAETAVFQNQTILSRAASGITKAVPVAEVIVPFRRTPSAVAMQIFNYTPAGVVKPIYDMIVKGQFDQRLFSQAMGRGITGTAVMFLGAELFKKNMITGARPIGEREQKLWELEGKQANSIKIGGKWRQVQVLGPVGNLFIMGSIFQKNFNNSGSPTEAVSGALAESASAFTQQTFLTGVSNFIDAISDPARSAAYVAGSTLASTIPTIVSDVARATDTKERRTQSILERFMLRLPGGREILQPQVDVLGKEIETQNPLEVMADPTRPLNVKTSLVIEELKRLSEKGFKVSPTLLGDKKGYEALTPEQNTQLWKKAGEITNTKLTALFNHQPYIDAPDDEKAKIVEEFVDKSKIVARAEMVVLLTQGLQGEELKNKLSEIKKSGFLTRDVYNKYLEIK